jgi:hypothetical protein
MKLNSSTNVDYKKIMATKRKKLEIKKTSAGRFFMDELFIDNNGSGLS